MKLIFNWRTAALCLVLGLLAVAVQHVQVARALSSPTFYPVGVISYAGYPCPSNVSINGKNINLGTNCSAANNTVVNLDPTLQDNPQGWPVVIGPNWTQQCNGSGAAKSLGSYTWSGNLPNARTSTGAMFMHTFPNVCGSPTNFTVMIQSAAYGDSSEWIIKMYIAG